MALGADRPWAMTDSRHGMVRYGLRDTARPYDGHYGFARGMYEGAHAVEHAHATIHMMYAHDAATSSRGAQRRRRLDIAYEVLRRMRVRRPSGATYCFGFRQLQRDTTSTVTFKMGRSNQAVDCGPLCVALR